MYHRAIAALVLAATIVPADAAPRRPGPPPSLRERIKEAAPADRPARAPHMLPNPDAPASLIAAPPVPGIARPSDAAVSSPAVPGDVAGSTGIANPVPLPHPGIEPMIGTADTLGSPAHGGIVGKERARIAREIAGRGPGMGLRPGIPKGLGPRTATPGADGLGAAPAFAAPGRTAGELPPGLAGREQLPPGLAKRNGELPPGLERRPRRARRDDTDGDTSGTGASDSGAGAGEDAAVQAFTASESGRGRRERGARRRAPRPEPMAAREQLPDVGF